MSILSFPNSFLGPLISFPTFLYHFKLTPLCCTHQSFYHFPYFAIFVGNWSSAVRLHTQEHGPCHQPDGAAFSSNNICCDHLQGCPMSGPWETDYILVVSFPVCHTPSLSLFSKLPLGVVFFLKLLDLHLSP